MTYKDQDKQREANKEQMRRARAKGNTNQVVNQGNTENSRVTDKALLSGGVTQVIEDIGVRDEVLEAAGIKSKRGKDIKCFADLPPDVQEVIHKLSTIDGKIDQRVKANRTAIAINYQHLFPDRFHSTGVAI